MSGSRVAARIALMVFSGRYDVTCKRQWSEVLGGLCGEPNVIIDFSDVSYRDATCVTEMLRMHARRHDKGFDREIVILGRSTVRRLFDLLKMQGVVRVVECLDDSMRLQRSAPIVRYAFCGNAGTSARKRDHQA